MNRIFVKDYLVRLANILVVYLRIKIFAYFHHSIDHACQKLAFFLILKNSAIAALKPKTKSFKRHTSVGNTPTNPAGPVFPPHNVKSSSEILSDPQSSYSQHSSHTSHLQTIPSIRQPASSQKVIKRVKSKSESSASNESIKLPSTSTTNTAQTQKITPLNFTSSSSNDPSRPASRSSNKKPAPKPPQRDFRIIKSIHNIYDPGRHLLKVEPAEDDRARHKSCDSNPTSTNCYLMDIPDSCLSSNVSSQHNFPNLEYDHSEPLRRKNSLEDENADESPSTRPGSKYLQKSSNRNSMKLNSKYNKSTGVRNSIRKKTSQRKKSGEKSPTILPSHSTITNLNSTPTTSEHLLLNPEINYSSITMEEDSLTVKEDNSNETSKLASVSQPNSSFFNLSPKKCLSTSHITYEHETLTRSDRRLFEKIANQNQNKSTAVLASQPTRNRQLQTQNPQRVSTTPPEFSRPKNHTTEEKLSDYMKFKMRDRPYVVKGTGSILRKSLAYANNYQPNAHSYASSRFAAQNPNTPPNLNLLGRSSTTSNTAASPYHSESQSKLDFLNNSLPLNSPVVKKLPIDLNYSSTLSKSGPNSARSHTSNSSGLENQLKYLMFKPASSHVSSSNLESNSGYDLASDDYEHRSQTLKTLKRGNYYDRNSRRGSSGYGERDVNSRQQLQDQENDGLMKTPKLNLDETDLEGTLNKQILKEKRRKRQHQQFLSFSQDNSPREEPAKLNGQISAYERLGLKK